VVLAFFVLVNDFLGAEEFGFKVTMEHFALTFLLSDQVVGFIRLFRPLVIFVINCFRSIFPLLVHLGL